VKVVTREAMHQLREIQALDAAIESLERDLDHDCWSFSEAVSLHGHLQRLRGMRKSLASAEVRDEDISPVR